MTDDTPDLDLDTALSRIFVLADGVARAAEDDRVARLANLIAEAADRARELRDGEA